MQASSMGTRRAERLSEEEITLLGVMRRQPLGVDHAAERTGMPRGLAALAMELLELRGLV